MFDLNNALKEIKSSVDNKGLGMILVHNGLVRGTPKDKRGVVKSLTLSYNKEKLQQAVDNTYKKNPGIKKVIVWINEGNLSVGDDMMYVIVAGDRRKNILRPFEELIEEIKEAVVQEQEKLG